MTGKWMLHMVLLLFCSLEDWRKKEISCWKMVLYGGFVLVYGIAEGFGIQDNQATWFLQQTAGVIPGLFMLLLAKISKEAIGYGDGILMVWIGLSMGFWNGLGILLTALFGVWAAAVCIWLHNRNAKKQQIAFVPYLLLGMAGAGLWMGN